MTFAFPRLRDPLCARLFKISQRADLRLQRLRERFGGTDEQRRIFERHRLFANRAFVATNAAAGVAVRIGFTKLDDLYAVQP